MDELIDIIDANGKPSGNSVLKSIIHAKGYYHNTAHVWFYTNDGEILLSQRSSKKTICPLLWDVSVAGHVDSGETIKLAAIRETKEEIDLDIDMTSVRAIADKVAMLHGGKIRWHGPVAQLDVAEDPYLTQFITGSAHGPIETVR